MKRRDSLRAALGLMLSGGFLGVSVSFANDRRVLPKSAPIWTGFGLNGSAGAARFELTRQFVSRSRDGMALTDPKAFEFIRNPLRELLAAQNPPLVQFKGSVTMGEELVIGMAHDYEAAVAVRRVELNKPVNDGIMFTFMSGVGLIVGYQPNVGWRVVSSFSFMTRDERPISDVGKLTNTAVAELEQIYAVHARAFVTSLGRFSKWREGYSSNFFARVVSATVGKKALPKLAEYQLEQFITPELLGFELSSAICDGFNMPLMPFQENDALAKRYAAKFSESLMTQDTITLPDIDLEFEINLVDVTKEKVQSRQKGVTFIRRQVIISFRAFERFDKGPDGRKKLLQTFAAAPVDEDVIGFDSVFDDTPQRDFVFFGRLISRTLNLLITGIALKDASRLESVNVKYGELVQNIPKLMDLCAKTR